MDISHIPKELQNLPQWVCFRFEPDKKTEKLKKVPINPHSGYKASTVNPQTWGTLKQALDGKDKFMLSGIGFVFTEESGIVGIDLDHCLENLIPNDTAADILARLPPTYIEVSPSGAGLHIFLHGKLPEGGNRNSKKNVEMYATGRFFTTTGKPYENSSDFIGEDNGVIQYILEKYVINQTKIKSRQSFSSVETLPDSEILKLAGKSKDGDAFNALFKGEWQGAYASQSEADYALCRKLAFWTARNEAQMHRLIRQSGLMRPKWEERHSSGGYTYGETTVLNACKATAQIYTPPNQKRESEIFEQGGMYYRRKGEKFYPITNFIVDPIEMIVSSEEAQITCDFVTEGGERFRQHLIAEDMTSLRTFKSVIGKKTIALSFLGSESDLDLFKIHIYNFLSWVKKRGVRALGIYPRESGRSLVFVNTKGAIAAGGRAVNDMVQLEEYRGIESNILSPPMLDKTGLLLLAEHILTYNEPAKTVPILAWVAGCFIKPHLKKVKLKFPHLFLIGEPGSGKSSSMERIIYPIVGQTRIYAASQVTSFTLMKEANTSNIIPLLLDEFKPSKIKPDKVSALYNHFRDSYDWHKGIRGRSDQSQVFYDLMAPIAVAGEESAAEAAIRERSNEILFSKKDLKTPGARESFLWLCGHENFVRSFGRSLLDTALRTTPKEAAAWHNEGYNYFAPELPDRIRANLCACYAGLSLVNKLCQLLDTSFDAVFPLDHEKCAAQLEAAAKVYLLDNSTFNKGTVEDALEIMSRMKLKLGEEYCFENNRQYLCIWMKQVYDKYTKYRKDYAIVGEVLERGQWLKQLQNSVYYIDSNVVKRFGKATHRCWVLDFHRLSKACDVSEFVQEEESQDGE